MIARTWRGATRAAAAERYLAYLHRSGFAAFQATPGNAGVLALRRIVDHFDVVFSAQAGK